jgi:hypothetical protein
MNRQMGPKTFHQTARTVHGHSPLEAKDEQQQKTCSMLHIRTASVMVHHSNTQIDFNITYSVLLNTVTIFY